MSEARGRAATHGSWPSPNGKIPGWLPAFNRISKFLMGAGVPLGPNVLVTIRGRTTGLPRTTPMALITVDGRRWVWAPSAQVQWVRNLRAAGRAVVSTRRGPEDVRATELDQNQRVAFFRDTLGPAARKVPLGVQFVRVMDRVDLNDPEGAAAGRAVFELSPVPEADSVS